MKRYWTSHTTNEEMLAKSETKRTLQTKIRNRQLEFLGAGHKKNDLESLMLMGNIIVKRDRSTRNHNFKETHKLSEYTTSEDNPCL